MPKGTTSKETVGTRSYSKKHFFMVKFLEVLGSTTYFCFLTSQLKFRETEMFWRVSLCIKFM
jgi:hypothetical protein